MISAEAAVAACTQAAEAHATTLPWPDAVHQTVRSLIDRYAHTHGHKPPLNDPRTPAAEAALDTLGPLDGWHVLDLGEIHQRLLELTPTHGPDGAITVSRKGQGRRDTQGSWYTPPELAEVMCSLSLGPQLDRLAEDPDPGAMFDVLVIDPACGAGVFLIEAARYVTARLTARTTGTSPAPAAHVKAALPVVLRECIFGVDIDPVAVDLTKAALWLEAGAAMPFGFLNRNVIVGDPLCEQLPPAFLERRVVAAA